MMRQCVRGAKKNNGLQVQRQTALPSVIEEEKRKIKENKETKRKNR